MWPYLFSVRWWCRKFDLNNEFWKIQVSLPCSFSWWFRLRWDVFTYKCFQAIFSLFHLQSKVQDRKHSAVACLFTRHNEEARDITRSGLRWSDYSGGGICLSLFCPSTRHANTERNICCDMWYGFIVFHILRFVPAVSCLRTCRSNSAHETNPPHVQVKQKKKKKEAHLFSRQCPNRLTDPSQLDEWDASLVLWRSVKALHF